MVAQTCQPPSPRSCLKIKTKFTQGTSQSPCLNPRGTVTEKATHLFCLVGASCLFSQNPQWQSCVGSNLDCSLCPAWVSSRLHGYTHGSHVAVVWGVRMVRKNGTCVPTWTLLCATVGLSPGDMTALGIWLGHDKWHHLALVQPILLTTIGPLVGVTAA